MDNNTQNILIVGVGGQGVLLASELLSEVAMMRGLDVKKSEVHGMSQRGGVVSSHVRIGAKVYSPIIPYGQAEIVMSFEQAEGLRAMDWLAKDGRMIVSTTRLVPTTANFGGLGYPDDPIAEMKKKTKNVIAIEADKIANELGNPRLINTILLAVASPFLGFEKSVWEEAIKKLVKPKFVDINLKAFAQGSKLAEASL
ncbi:MAG: indolepyruvate oxidoreductase subunit beta [candidate division Zixibacteria bacterium]|nr:indolepyruvate oxidoreductase subunit beta [candidate division Zixibacteria bacterium]